MALASRPDEAWGAADAYERVFAPLTGGAVAALLDAAGPVGALLDVGCGPGTVTAPALRRGWRVTGVDPSPAMLDRARVAAPAATLLPGALPDLPVADADVDAAVASFVVNHLPDPLAGVRGLVRAARPGGRIAVTIWASGSSGMNRLLAAVLEDAGVPPLPGSRLPADRDFARTEAGLAGLLTAGGATDVTAGMLRWTWPVAADRLWLGVESGITTAGLTYRAQDREGRDRIRAAFERRVAAEGGDVLRLDAVAVLGSGRRAG